MFALGSTFHHNVVNADLHSLIDQGFEDLCHQPLISSANILKPKWHNSITVQPVWCHKDCFFLIWLEHGDLVVLNESVYEGEHFVPVSGIYYLVYSGQKKKSYHLGKHHSSWCNKHRLTISHTFLERPPHLPTSPDIQPPLWIRQLTICQSQPGWSSACLGGSAEPFGGRVVKKVLCWVNVSLQMDGFLACQSESRRKRLFSVEAHFQVALIHPTQWESCHR